MTRQRGQFGLVVGIVLVILALALIGLFAVCTPGENDHSLGRVRLVSHQRDDGDCDWNGDCGDDSYRNEYGRGRNGDQGRAGRDQCHSFCNNVIIIPDPTKKDQPPEGER